MPENDINKERIVLKGDVTYGPTTDEAIIARIHQLGSHEIPGIPDPEIVLEGETLSTIPVVPSTLVEPVESEKQIITSVGVKLGPVDSALGKLFVKDRLAKLKKAA